MIESEIGGTKLALFQGKPQENAETKGFHRVAFRVSGESFLTFLNLLPQFSLKDETGSAVQKTDARDHQGAFSIYFCDPYGHRLEVTSYDHEIIRESL